MLNIKSLKKVEVFTALYNQASGVNSSFFDSSYDEEMTEEKAMQYLRKAFDEYHKLYFDYINGHALKIDITQDEVDTSRYNEYNGPRAAESAIAPLLAKLHEPKEVKPLSVLAATFLFKHKQQYAGSLSVLPRDIRDRHPELEVDPLHLFRRKVLNLLAKHDFAADSEEQAYKNRMLVALDKVHPYNSIHPIVVVELRARLKEIFLSTFTTKMKPIYNEILGHMREYLAIRAVAPTQNQSTARCAK